MVGDCFIYVIAHMRGGRTKGPVKIGVSNTPCDRLAQLQTGNPYRLTIVHTFRVPCKDVAFEVERCIAHIAADRQTNGEWYDLEPSYAVLQVSWALLSAIDELADLPSHLRAVAIEDTGIAEARDVIKRLHSAETEGA